MYQFNQWGKFILLSLLFSLSAVMTSCVNPELTPHQRRMLTTRTFDANQDMVFRSVMTILQDHQYVIKTSDLKTGLITAEVSKNTGAFVQVMALTFRTADYISSVQVELSAVVSPLSDQNTEVRINIQEKQFNNKGNLAASKQVLEPAVLETLFNDIRVEIQRKQALN